MNSKVLLVSLVSALGGLLFGFDTAVISGTISMVSDQFALGLDAEGWFVSSALLGCVIGVSISGFMSDMFGRKKILILAAVFFTLSALGCAVSQSVAELITYRLLGGMGIGIASILSPMYIAELSPAKYRGRLVALYQLAITIGILSAYFSNAEIVRDMSDNLSDSWRWMFAAEVIPAVLFLMLLFFIPESPRWLLSKGKFDKATAVLKKYLPESNLAKNTAHSLEQSEKNYKLIDIIRNRSILNIVIIGSVLAALSQLSGINAIIYFGPEILSDAGLSLGDSYGGQVTIGIVNVAFTLLAIWKIDSWGRKPLLLSGIIGVIIALTMCGSYFYFGWDNSILIIILITFFIACFAFSYGPVTWIIISEIYPTRIRGVAMSIATLSLWLTNVLIGQFFPRLNDWSQSGTFFIFAGITFVAFFFVLRLVPETKNKSLEEIERELS